MGAVVAASTDRSASVAQSRGPYRRESRQKAAALSQLDKTGPPPSVLAREISSGKPWVDRRREGLRVEKDKLSSSTREFAKTNVKATKTIDIQDFSPIDQIDCGIRRLLYVVPQGPPRNRSFVLLREVAKDGGPRCASYAHERDSSA